MARARNKATEANENTAADEAAEMAALEAALNGEGDAELEIDDADFADLSDEDLDEALKADEATEKARDAEQPAEESEPAAAEQKEEKSEAKEPKVTKGQSSGPNATRDADLFAQAVYDILGDSAALDSEEGDLTEAQLKDAMKEITQIKVREKVLNLCNHIINGRELNRYTQIAVKVLVDAQLDGCKPVTMPDLKKAYEEAGYKPGTVNAQSGQLMALFRSMGMGKPKGRGVLEPNENSVILDILASS